MHLYHIIVLYHQGHHCHARLEKMFYAKYVWHSTMIGPRISGCIQCDMACAELWHQGRRILGAQGNLCARDW